MTLSDLLAVQVSFHDFVRSWLCRFLSMTLSDLLAVQVSFHDFVRSLGCASFFP